MLRAVALAATLVPGASLAQGIPYRDHPMMWGGGWLGMIVMLLIGLALILLLVALAKRVGGDAAPRRDPLDILKERFARGEIDEDEYERRKRALRD